MLSHRWNLCVDTGEGRGVAGCLRCGMTCSAPSQEGRLKMPSGGPSLWGRPPAASPGKGSCAVGWNLSSRAPLLEVNMNSCF